MPFFRGSATHTIPRIHSFRNDPDYIHQTCMKCGCKKVRTYSNKSGRNILTYYDKYGNQLPAAPAQCRGLYDILNSDETL